MPRETIQYPKVIVNVPFDTTGIDPADQPAVGTHQVVLGDKNFPADFPKGATLTGGQEVAIAWQRTDGTTTGWVQVSIENIDSGISQVSDPMSRYEINKMIRILRRARDAAFEADA